MPVFHLTKENFKEMKEKYGLNLPDDFFEEKSSKSPNTFRKDLKEEKKLLFKDWTNKFIAMLKCSKDKEISSDDYSIFNDKEDLLNEFYDFIDILMFTAQEANSLIGTIGWEGERALFNANGYKFYARIISGQGTVYQLFDYEEYKNNDWFKEVVIINKTFNEIIL